MTTHKEALTLALEALESTDKLSYECWMRGYGEKAITAIKEALAQPEQEPVVHIGYVPEGGFGGGKYFERLVAWKHLPVGAKLYITPPQRKPLTDAEIEKLREKTFSTENPFCPVDSKSMRKAVRAAEAAHGIKGDA